MTFRYELCPVETNDGMWDHPTPRIRRDDFDGVWLLDEAYPGPTDAEVMRPIIDAAMREDDER